jgi:hypothetical protein
MSRSASRPSVVLILAVMWDRRQRKRTEKPPQTTKLLRPPGHSLSIKLDNTLDSLVFSLLMATVLCAFSAGCVVKLAGFCSAEAPLVVGLAVTTLFLSVVRGCVADIPPCVADVPLALRTFRSCVADVPLLRCGRSALALRTFRSCVADVPLLRRSCGFLQRQDGKMEPAQVRRIISALDEKCRDVEF